MVFLHVFLFSEFTITNKTELRENCLKRNKTAAVLLGSVEYVCCILKEYVEGGELNLRLGLNMRLKVNIFSINGHYFAPKLVC